MAAAPDAGSGSAPTMEALIDAMRDVYENGGDGSASGIDLDAPSTHLSMRLAEVIGTDQDIDPRMREAAEVLLSQRVQRNVEEWPPEARAYIKAHVLAAISHSDSNVHRRAATLVSLLVMRCVAPRGSFGTWPELISRLCLMLVPDAPRASVEGALYTCSEVWKALPIMMLTHAEFGELFAAVVRCFGHPTAECRALALHACLPLLKTLGRTTLPGMAAYVAGLSALVTDADACVRATLCDSLAEVAARSELLTPYIPRLVGFAVDGVADEDPRVKFASCELLTTFLEDGGSEVAEPIVPTLDKLVNTLLKNMVYSEAELVGVATEDEAGGGEESKGSGGAADDEEMEPEFTLRKAAAMTLDTLTQRLGSAVLPHVLSELNARLSSDDDSQWLDAEAAILAFGATAQRQEPEFHAMFQKLYPLLLQRLSHSRPLIRTITCWSMSRMSTWLVQQRDDAMYTNAVQAQFRKLMLDRHEKVQAAASSALATLVEAGGPKLAPLVEPILDTIATALDTCKPKNRVLVYDTLSTVCDALGSDILGEPAHATKLAGPIVNVLASCADDSEQLLPLLECIASVARGGGEAFLPYAADVYARCLRLLHTSLFAGAPGGDVPDVVDGALDVTSAMFDALGARMSSIADTGVVDAVYACLRGVDGSPPQSMSACALVGDIAKACPVLLAHKAADIAPLLVQCLRPASVYMCTNAAWSLSELCVAEGLNEAVRPVVVGLVPRLAALAADDSGVETLKLNVAMALGRLAMVFPAEVSPLAPSFVPAWMPHLQLLATERHETQGTTDAFQGILELLRRNPAAIMPHFATICEAMVWCGFDAPSNMQAVHRELVAAFRESAGAAWPDAVATLTAGSYGFLATRYDLVPQE